MKDEEYSILDELYFVTSYRDLKNECELNDETILSNLVSMVDNGLVRVYKSVDEVSELAEINLKEHYKEYFYLASKKGLFKHNSV